MVLLIDKRNEVTSMSVRGSPDHPVASSTFSPANSDEWGGREPMRNIYSPLHPVISCAIDVRARS